MYLARFDFFLHNCPDKSIEKPDALSQRLDHSDSSYNNKDIVLIKLEFEVVCVMEELAFEEKNIVF